MATKMGFFLFTFFCIGGYGLGFGLPYGGLGSATVCENIYGRAGLGGIGYAPGYAGMGLPYVSGATVCENVPNLLGYGNRLGSTTVCESSPNLYGSIGLGYAGLGLPVAPVGPVGLGSSTVCESAPNLGIGLSGPNYPGLGLPYGFGGLGYGVPFL